MTVNPDIHTYIHTSIMSTLTIVCHKRGLHVRKWSCASTTRDASGPRNLQASDASSFLGEERWHHIPIGVDEVGTPSDDEDR